QTERFLQEHDGKLRVSVDSLTELAYYADEERVEVATERILTLLDEHDAVGLFHLSPEVHDAEVVEAFEELFDGVIELAEDGSVDVRFG
ncbi:MAG: hypothetical protein ABEJ55_02610, partial [Halanaeroarchaeum sp.]